MRLFCVIPTLRVPPVAATQSVDIQTRLPDYCWVSIDSIENVYNIGIDGTTEYVGAKERIYAAANIAKVIQYSNCRYGFKDEDIICLIDGDDWLCDDRAFEIVYNAHKSGAWLTYGSYITSTEQRTVVPKKLHRGPYRNHDNYRNVPWRASHLKTFRYGLYRRLNPYWYIGPDGKSLKVCSDLALMFPMLEMAGKEHIQHINKRLYVYNDENPENDHKIRAREQKEVEMWIRRQEPYKKIEVF